MNMRQAMHWENSERVKSHVAQRLKDSQVGIVLGSGISAQFGLPDWDELLKELAKGKKMPRDFKSQSAPEKASHIKRTVYNDEDEPFNGAVKAALYKKANLEFGDLQGNAVLSAIGALIMSSSRGSVSNVINFNFDDVLELFLQYYGFTVESHATSTPWTSDSDVQIFHPHGFLPLKTGNDSKKIVLDSEGFDTILHHDPDWESRIYSIMSSTFMIFIGLSGDDLHLDKHLQKCAKRHVARVGKMPYWGIWFTTDLDTVTAEKWKARKVFPVELKDWNELPDWLFKICQLSAGITFPD